MQFNSIEFGIFILIFYAGYWLLNARFKAQNFFILAGSYFFYAWWDWHFIFLLLLSTLIDYCFGLLISTSKRPRLYLILSLINNLGILCVFKYYNFFYNSLIAAFSRLNIHLNAAHLNIMLPIGISFYTFHGMSYVFDIYRKKIEPTKNFIDYSVFVCFFPLLVSGPIERANHLLPQVKTSRVFNYAQSVAGLRLILWGFFKKIVIADSLAENVNAVFAHYTNFTGSTLVLASISFSFQIYCDFSGYTDIAIGLGKLLGFEILTNFRFPYFSKNIREFWQRWHISLTSWFRDYVYIPLGGSKLSKIKTLRNIYIVFLLSALWHGANWTFIIWGFIHATLFILLLLSDKKDHQNINSITNPDPHTSFTHILKMMLTFGIVTLAWIFFRSPSISSAVAYIEKMPHHFFTVPQGISSLLYITIIVLLEWVQRNSSVNILRFKNCFVRYAIYIFLTIAILTHIAGNHIEFIYFQF